MEIRQLRLTTFKLMLGTLALSVCLCHGNEVQVLPSVEILDSPPPYIKILSGSDVDFTWKFRVFDLDAVQKISWYFVISQDNRKAHHKIIQKSFVGNSSKESGNPSLKPNKRNRVNCTFNLDNHIWTMSCLLSNANAYDSASYGMKVELHGNEHMTNVSALKVIDLIIDKKKSDHVVQSWIGHPTVLKCAIHKKTKLKHLAYEWSVVSDAKDITRGITRAPSKTSYTLIPVSKRDFGKYKCTIRTATTTVEHEILLQQIDYAGPPQSLRIDVTNGGVSLLWSQPRSNGGTKIINYVVIVEGKGDVTRKNATGLSAGVKLTDNNLHVIRVCSRNRIGYRIKDSCTSPREIKIARLPQKGNQDRLKNQICTILVATIHLIIWIL